MSGAWKSWVIKEHQEGFGRNRKVFGEHLTYQMSLTSCFTCPQGQELCLLMPSMVSSVMDFSSPSECPQKPGGLLLTFTSPEVCSVSKELQFRSSAPEGSLTCKTPQGACPELSFSLQF